MRYQVGEELFVIHFDYLHLRSLEQQFQAADFIMPFMMGNKEVPNKVHIERLTVTEHHQVAWDQDTKEEKKHDGYLLTDTQGAVFANQYPRASYGQISDTGDRRFRRHFEDTEDHDAIFAKFNSGEYQVYEYHLLGDVIRNMTEGVLKMGEYLQEGLQKHSQEDLNHYLWLQGVLADLLKKIKVTFQYRYPDMTYDVEDVNISDNPEKPFSIKRCIFKKKEQEKTFDENNLNFYQGVSHAMHGAALLGSASQGLNNPSSDRMTILMSLIEIKQNKEQAAVAHFCFYNVHQRDPKNQEDINKAWELFAKPQVFLRESLQAVLDHAEWNDNQDPKHGGFSIHPRNNRQTSQSIRQIAAAQKEAQKPGEHGTVKEMAKKFGKSISEIRRLKAQGFDFSTLPIVN